MRPRGKQRLLGLTSLLLRRFRTPPSEEAVVLRLSSFPFLSGDTFRLMAGVEFTPAGLEIRRGLPEGVGFVDTDFVASDEFFSLLMSYTHSSGRPLESLIIHNGDKTPPSALLQRILHHSSRVYSVNRVQETERLRALPIGLENLWRANYGRIQPFINQFSRGKVEARTKLVLSSFHTSTNPSVREAVAKQLTESRFGFDGHRWKRPEYWEQLRQSMFVISPPGNGNDCHRTWEAVYFGAVPVVLAGTLAESILDGMPILEVTCYEDFLSRSDSELTELFHRLSAREPRKAFLPFWVREIFSSIPPDDARPNASREPSLGQW